jgi:carbon-monoxide dehydrogenase small subunit
VHVGPEKPGMSELENVTLIINGQTYTLRLEPRRTLLDAIREEFGLTGTHVGCSTARGANRKLRNG